MRLTEGRMLVSGEGTRLAWFPSYTGGPSLSEACANARLGAGLEPDPAAATPGPWRLWPEVVLGDRLILGPDSQIVAQLMPAADTEVLAAHLIALRGTPCDPGASMSDQTRTARRATRQETASFRHEHPGPEND